MADHKQDEEDIEALRRWWDENGKGLVAAVVLAVFGTVGWQQYQNYAADREAAASNLYAAMLAIRTEDGDFESLLELAAGLKADHSSSAYARFGALLLASVAVEQGDLAAAEAELRWALAAGDTGSDFGQLIQLRLARVLAARGQDTEALAILGQGSRVYPVAFAQAEGDIYLAAGRESDALRAYRAGRDAALELGQASVALDGKVRTLESRLGNQVELDDSEGAG